MGKIYEMGVKANVFAKERRDFASKLKSFSGNAQLLPESAKALK